MQYSMLYFFHATLIGGNDKSLAEISYRGGAMGISCQAKRRGSRVGVARGLAVGHQRHGVELEAGDDEPLEVLEG